VPDVALTCAGRTDSGVHARGQVVHLDVDAFPEGAERLARRLNGVLAPDVRVRRATEAPEGFDARFSALWRRYAYRVADRAELVDPLRRGQVLTWPRPVDEELMNAAALTLLGEHDFAAFCKQREGATTIRALLDLRWERDPDGVLVAHVRADAFCHSMVRSLVGCLLAVGEGRRPVGWAADVLAAARRDSAVAVAPAHGLTLEEVGYPPEAELAARVEITRTRRG
jgi:tRNA pseudouridine38-40 synthase